MYNVFRVQTLLGAAEGMPLYELEGPALRSDMIRAGVLLMHASLEDLIRSLAEIGLPIAQAAVLRAIPLMDTGDESKLKFDLGDLVGHRDKTVDDLIRKSVVAHLSRTTYNNVEQLARALNQLGLPLRLLAPHGANLAALMSRRHHIAHRADRGERGEGLLRTIDLSTVSTWVHSVEEFGNSLLQAFVPGQGDQETD